MDNVVYANLGEVVANVSEILKPPHRMTVPEASVENIWLNTPGGYNGPWSNELPHYMVEPAECLTSREYEAVIFSGPAQSAKALDVSTRIPTPSGWNRMGELRAGDFVFGDDGKPVVVDLATDYMYDHDCYEVTFSCGGKIVADAGHLWTVNEYYRDGTFKQLTVLETVEMLPRFKNGNRNLFSIDNAKELCLPDVNFPVDPYVLGVWLGDGDPNHTRITTSKEDHKDLIRYISDAGHSVEINGFDKRNKNVVYLSIDKKPIEKDFCFRGHDKRIVGITSGGWCAECDRQNYRKRKYDIRPDKEKYSHNGLRRKLTSLGVLVDKGCNKHIPAEYLRGSASQRLALLQGLMDTDGTCSKKGKVSFTTSISELADGFSELLASLGFKATIIEKQTFYTLNGIKKRCKNSFNFNFTAYSDVRIFRFKRKQKRIKNRLAGRPSETLERRITNIQKVKSRPVKCIRVKNKSHLYLAGDIMVPTHNTQMLVDNWAAHTIMCDPADHMIVQTAQDTARDYSKRRIDRLLNNSAKIKEKLKKRADADNTYDKYFKSGMILSLGWPTKNQLSGKAIGKMALTDYDRMPEDVNGEGAPFFMAMKRTTTFMSRGMTMAESSPSKAIIDPNWKSTLKHEAPPTLGILGLYNSGDMRRAYGRCPHCNEYFMPSANIEAIFIPEIADVDEAAKGSMLICAECGSTIDQTHEITFKKSLRWVRQGQFIDAEGVITGEALKSRRASFWLPGWFAAFQTWEAIVRQYLYANAHYKRTNDEEALKNTTNLDQGAPYLPKALKNRRGPSELAERAEPSDKRVVPAGVRFLTAQIDVQAYGFVVQVHGWGKDRECWLIDRFKLRMSHRYEENGDSKPADPAGYAEDWDLITSKVIRNSYPLSDNSGRRMAVKITACDSGGKAGVTDKAYEYWRKLKRLGIHERLLLVKGASAKEAKRIRLSYPDSNKSKANVANAAGEIPLLLLNTTILKDEVNGSLNRTEQGAGYFHFPAWLPGEVYEELTAETRTNKGWENKSRAHNEAFDLSVYGLALYYFMNVHKFDWENKVIKPWAETWDKNNMIIDGDDSMIFERKSRQQSQKRKRKIRSRH